MMNVSTACLLIVVFALSTARNRHTIVVILLPVTGVVIVGVGGLLTRRTVAMTALQGKVLLFVFYSMSPRKYFEASEYLPMLFLYYDSDRNTPY